LDMSIGKGDGEVRRGEKENTEEFRGRSFFGKLLKRKKEGGLCREKRSPRKNGSYCVVLSKKKGR